MQNIPTGLSFCLSVYWWPVRLKRRCLTSSAYFMHRNSDFMVQEKDGSHFESWNISSLDISEPTGSQLPSIFDLFSLLKLGTVTWVYNQKKWITTKNWNTKNLIKYSSTLFSLQATRNYGVCISISMEYTFVFRTQAFWLFESKTFLGPEAVVHVHIYKRSVIFLRVFKRSPRKDFNVTRIILF